MTQQFPLPITPPPELVRHWSRFQGDTDPETLWFRIANEAAQWGADQELEACIAWFDRHIPGYELVADRLRSARRPKPPSLKEQALKLLDKAEDPSWDINDFSIVRKALEQLPES
jgi:hypothetical protein